LLAEGYKADINILDYDKLAIHLPHMVADLPGGGRRLMQAADGYVATIVSGTPIQRNGQPTGALPGKLVRGAQPAPIAESH
jgi:N-acyl-D-amino-acid deacylase